MPTAKTTTAPPQKAPTATPKPLALAKPVSKILDVPAAGAADAARHFAAKLSVETDASDVKTDLDNGVKGFVVVDCRSAESFAKGHVPGALSIPYRTISPETTRAIPKDTVIVTYCSGVHCNASTKGAVRFAELGFRVKEIIGGLDAWSRERYPVQTS